MSALPSLPRTSRLLAALTPDEVEGLEAYLEQRSFAPGEVVLREGEQGHELYVVQAGRAQVERRGLRMQTIGPGEPCGEISFLSPRPRAATVVAIEPLTVAVLGRPSWERLQRERPELSLRLMAALVESLGELLVRVTDNVGLLLRERSLPRRTQVVASVGGERRQVHTGTPAGEVLPPTDGGALVVAALIDRKPVSLAAPLAADAVVEPLSTLSWEGREVYRRSAGLLLLEASHRVAPEMALRLGPSLSSAQVVEVPPEVDLAALAARLQGEMGALAAANAPFVEEQWTIEEATSHFASRHWRDAELLLGSWRDPTVPLVTCGSVYALSLGPLLPSTGPLSDLRLRPYHGGLLLEFGQALTCSLPEGVREVGDQAAEQAGPARSPDMVIEHKGWLSALGATSVGAFNERCVSGQVTELIRVAEGFHEKRIGRVADRISEQGRSLRIICIAGPSSSGKTTFIKRLTVQLQVNGILPRAISLDDYYVDRALTPRDAQGDYDFEALEALSLGLLQKHLKGLIEGQRVRTAHFDFRAGQSQPELGPEIELGPRDVLMLEGIHGLNPALLGSVVPREQVFKIFIHPVVGLPLDRLSSVNPADIRLLRRIVRDRHARGYKAADNIARWPSVRDGERRHIFPFLPEADAVFDSSLVYEPSVLKVYAERYLLEVPREHPAYATAYRLRRLIDRFVSIYPDHVPPTSILREFIGGSGFEY